MNKQALAFLTLFSLILMLSVYYVTLPSDVTAVVSEETQETSEDAADTSASNQEDTSARLQDTIAQTLNEKINEAKAVMADAESSESDKQDALATIEKLEQVKEQQQQIQTKVQELGYENAVEISDGTCRITLYNCEENKDTVNQVMNAAYGVVKENYLLEVTFKTS